MSANKTESLNIRTHKSKPFSDLIERVWIAENQFSEVEMVVPPNPYVNLVFPVSGSRYSRNNVLKDVPQIEGVSVQNALFTYPSKTKIIGVRFFAFGLFPFIEVQGKDIFNSSIIYPQENLIADKFNTILFDTPDSIIIDKVYDILSDLFSESRYKKITSVKKFYNEYRWNDDTLTIEDYCIGLETNYTSLNRRFTEIIGISPKKFERLIKFRKSLCSLIDSNEALTSIGLNSGYFDQAHFIREFKMFLKQTPSKYKKSLDISDDNGKIINYNFNLI